MIAFSEIFCARQTVYKLEVFQCFVDAERPGNVAGDDDRVLRLDDRTPVLFQFVNRPLSAVDENIH